MTDDLPSELISAVTEGRAVLLLGAGASYGAQDAQGTKIPLGAALANELIEAYLGVAYAGLDFRAAYDLSCSQRDVRTVQKFVHDRLFPYSPAQYHLKIPSFAWAGILGTNYDLIVERAYERKGTSCLQRLVPLVKDDTKITASLDTKSVLYVKLHGCISQASEVQPPLIASTEQLINYRDGRYGQFDIFLEWSKTKTLIFVGYSFSDSNLRQLLDEIVREGDKRPRHYIVDPGILPAIVEYWRDRRFVAIKQSFEQFLDKLDIAISDQSRSLSSLSALLNGSTSLSRYITVANIKESPALAQYLKYGIDHISPELEVPDQDPKKFYKGFGLGWYPFTKDLDVRRAVSDDLISNHILSVKGGSQSLIVLKGHAGSGKSISLRRACWDAATNYEKLCLFVSSDALINLSCFDEIFSLTNVGLFLFVDGLAVHERRIIELLSIAKLRNYTLTIIGSESFNTWNTRCESLQKLVTAEHEMRHLSTKEILTLIEKLETYDSLGSLARLARDKRQGEFEDTYGRQILVALLEATHGEPLVDILLKEYESVNPYEARLLYLDICSLNRFGPPVRAGLISRIHDIDFHEFRSKFYRPLEQIVELRDDRRSQDFVYEARHAQMAEALYNAILVNQEERFDNIARIITKLNPSYSYDMDVLGQILRADSINRTVTDQNRARQLYDIAIENVGEMTFLLHQRGIYELRVANSLGALRNAGEFLEKASAKEPRNRSIKHSLAELDLKRSRVASDQLEKEAWRRAAAEKASSLTLGDSSPYPYHTLLKAATDGVEDALAFLELNDTDTATLKLGESIAHAEDVLKRGLQRFPNDQSLLSGEGQLATVLSNANRAETAFRKAFAKSPRSTLIARRLVRILRAKGDLPGCMEILPKALAANPASPELHYDIARVLMTIAPDADQKNGDIILFHLRRSFAPNDRNYRGQFWYARQLCIMNRFTDAQPYFKSLEQLNMAFSKKLELQGVLRLNDGNNRRFRGTVVSFRSLYAFLKCETLDLTAFVGQSDIEAIGGRSLYEGTSVYFDLGFNFRGPVATVLKTDS
jgi:tetratricopeptide (TPR) repeat protein